MKFFIYIFVALSLSCDGGLSPNGLNPLDDDDVRLSDYVFAVHANLTEQQGIQYYKLKIIKDGITVREIDDSIGFEVGECGSFGACFDFDIYKPDESIVKFPYFMQVEFISGEGLIAINNGIVTGIRIGRGGHRIYTIDNSLTLLENPGDKAQRKIEI